MAKEFIKAKRIFSPLRQWGWLFILLVAGGGLWYPRLGLLMIPIMIALGVFGFRKGKYWCGNICPHGSLFDYIILPVSRNVSIPRWMRTRGFVLLFFMFFMYMLGGRIIKAADMWGQIVFWDKLGFIFVINYFVVTVVGTTLAFFVSPRAWCTFCPMGTMQNAFYKLGKWTGGNVRSDSMITISDIDSCKVCGKCSRVCPMQLKPHENFNQKGQFEDAACIRCGTCVVNCSKKLLSVERIDKAGSKAEKIAS